MKYWTLIFVILVSGCSLENRMERKLKRAERKIEKLTLRFPSLIVKDTLHDTIKIVTPNYRVDTVFEDTNGDTIFIDNDILRIKYIRVRDSIYLSGECKSDTIIQTVSIPYEKIVVQKQTFIEAVKKYIRFILGFLLILVLTYIAIRIAWKFIKPI